MSVMYYGNGTAAHEPMYAPFLGSMGVTAAMAMSAAGAAYATAKSAEGIAATWTRWPKFGMRALVPVVMAGIISIYGLVVGVVIAGKLESSEQGYKLYAGFAHFGAGLAAGGCSLGAGYAVGVSGDHGIRALGKKPELFVGFVLIWAWGQLLGLYGLLVALVMANKA